MATPVSDRPRVAQHYADVVEMNEALVEALRELEQPAQPLPADYLEQFTTLVDLYASASISLSKDYYEELRATSGVPGVFTAPVVEPVAASAVEAGVLTALAFVDLAPDLGEVEIAAALQSLLEGLAKTLVMEAGRDEIWTALEQDPKARGWARVTRANACAFCRMLATRGAVYRTERSASFMAHHADEHGGGDCQCGVEPLFAERYEPPAHTRADQSLWSESTDGVPAGQKLNEFRRAVEGRTDGPRRRKRTRAGR